MKIGQKGNLSRVTLPVFLALAVTSLVVGGGRAVAFQAPAPAGPMTNADVIRLVEEGLSDRVIVAAIERVDETAFDIHPDALIAMKRAGVSEEVLAAVVERYGLQDAGPSGQPAVADEFRVPGVYVDLGAGPSGIVRMQPNVHSQDRLASVVPMALTLGLKKAKSILGLRGPRAQLQLGDAQPDFVFAFPDPYADLRQALQGPWRWDLHRPPPANPNEFVLARLTIKDGRRELVVGELGMGGSTGVRSRDSYPFTFEQVRPGLYRLRPARPLPTGEYAFLHMVHSGGGFDSGPGSAIFDFGVRAHPSSPS